MSFLSMRVSGDDSFLALWIHDHWIRGMVGKRLTNSKIHHKVTGEHLLLKVNFLIYQMGFSLALQIFPLISSGYTM